MSWFSVLGDIGGALLGSHSAGEANKTNIKLARENREWAEEMSDTAVQRRRRDFEAAGFNPVLAATGTGASTPSVSSPTVQPTFDPGWTKGTAASAALLKEQLLNMRANTANTAAQARSENVEADIREQLRDQERSARHNRFVEQQEWDDLRTRILRNTDVSSAAEARRLRETVDDLIRQAKATSRGKVLDVEALENIARLGGIEAGRAASIIKMIVDIFKD